MMEETKFGTMNTSTESFSKRLPSDGNHRRGYIEDTGYSEVWTHECSVVLFGLTYASAALMSIMNKSSKDFSDVIVVLYLDNIFV